jgi:predicted RNA binding protein YcfA (HicA-like mRNA interferase family)
LLAARRAALIAALGQPSGEPTPVVRKVLAVARFPSLKAKELIRVLQAQPLSYRIVRQKGSHRKLEAPNRPTITFAFHDNQTIRPATVKDILCNQVGLAEQDALALL